MKKALLKRVIFAERVKADIPMPLGIFAKYIKKWYNTATLWNAFDTSNYAYTETYNQKEMWGAKMSSDYDHNLEEQFIEELFFREWSKLVRYAKIQLRRYGPNTIDHEGRAEEIVQEVFYTAYKKAEEVKTSENPVGWLYTTLTYKVKEALREDRRWLKGLSLIPMDEEVLSQADAFELGDIIPKEGYLLLKHLYLDGYTYHELCDKYGCTKSCLAMRIHRIKKEFKKNYEKIFKNE